MPVNLLLPLPALVGQRVEDVCKTKVNLHKRDLVLQSLWYWKQISNDKTPDSIKKKPSTELLMYCYNNTHELPLFSKADTERLCLKQDAEFWRMLDVAVEQKIITNETKHIFSNKDAEVTSIHT
ncbi:6455_t:CDS:2 [Ambispora gerdemannii]|uniref:6455_t:CDS:1 n=1 Tax=Ambispora gerdemannii TaxID=144530 RepID=A0A9N9B1D4_9GLOM|nr:6455_t:CDS:2 [Ambispora gerdemannii]